MNKCVNAWLGPACKVKHDAPFNPNSDCSVFCLKRHQGRSIFISLYFTLSIFSPKVGENVALHCAWKLPRRPPLPNLLTTAPFQINLAAAPFVVPLDLLTRRYLLPAFIIRRAVQMSWAKQKTLIIAVSVLKEDAKWIFKVLLTHFASLLFFIYICMVHERKEKWSALMLSSAGIYSNAFATHPMTPWPLIFHWIEIWLAQLQWQ